MEYQLWIFGIWLYLLFLILYPVSNCNHFGRDGIIQKCEPQERSPCAPTFAERSQEDTLQQERCARGVAWNLANISFKLKKLYGAMLYSFIENWANKKMRGVPGPTSQLPEEREFVVD